VKHFEDVWLEAEVIASAWDLKQRDLYNRAVNEVETLTGEILSVIQPSSDFETVNISDAGKKKFARNIGSLLFILSNISGTFDVNVWTALEEATNDAKIDLYDEGEY
jgi:hypothetical protein